MEAIVRGMQLFCQSPPGLNLNVRLSAKMDKIGNDGQLVQ